MIENHDKRPSSVLWSVDRNAVTRFLLIGWHRSLIKFPAISDLFITPANWANKKCVWVNQLGVVHAQEFRSFLSLDVGRQFYYLRFVDYYWDLLVTSLFQPLEHLIESNYIRSTVWDIGNVIDLVKCQLEIYEFWYIFDIKDLGKFESFKNQ